MLSYLSSPHYQCFYYFPVIITFKNKHKQNKTLSFPPWLTHRLCRALAVSHRPALVVSSTPTGWSQHSQQLSSALAEHFPGRASSPLLIQLLSKPLFFHLVHFSCTTQLYGASPLWPLVFADRSEWINHSDTEPTVQSPKQLYWDSLCWGCWVAKSCHYTLFHVMDGHGREEAWTPLCRSLAELDSTVFPSWSYRADFESPLPNSSKNGSWQVIWKGPFDFLNVHLAD